MAPLYLKKNAFVQNLGIAYEEVSFPTSGGLVLRGCFFPADEPGWPPPSSMPLHSSRPALGPSLGGAAA